MDGPPIGFSLWSEQTVKVSLPRISPIVHIAALFVHLSLLAGFRCPKGLMLASISFSFLFGLVCVALFAATDATYQTGGDCRQINCNDSKINSHFLLAMSESLASTRHSRDSKRRNNLEKTFHPAVNSGGSPAGKQSEGLPAGTSHKVLLTRFSHAERNGWEGNDQGRKGKEGEEMKLLETYYPSPSNILNKRQPWLCFACCFPFKDSLPLREE